MSASALEDYARRARDTQEQLQGTSAPRPPIHHILETEKGPAPAVACGEKLYAVVYDLNVPVDVGEFRVHPLTASGRVDSVTCVACLRGLAKKGEAR